MFKLKSQLQTHTGTNAIIIKVQQGEWRLQQFRANVLKVVFAPDHYDRGEYLSDAVVAKPLPLTRKHDRSIGIFNYSVHEVEMHISGPVDLHLNFFDGAYDLNGFQFRLVEGERIYGGGARALPLNRRGHGFALYNAPNYAYGENAPSLNYSVPFITSSRGYGLFFDNPSRGYFDIGKKYHDIFEYASVSGELNFYLITGTPQTILSTYHQLTGTQPLPPRWVLGNLMSRFGYTSQQQVKAIARQMRKYGIPFDAVIFDLFWFGDTIQHTLGNLDWVNKKKWPDPKAMIAGFKKDNVQTVLITEPYFIEGTVNYNSMRPFFSKDANGEPYLMDMYFGKAGLIDIFRSDAQDQFWKRYKKQMHLGVEGWWGDLGEPEKHPADSFHDLHALGLKRSFGADEIHNLYGHTWTKFLFERFAKEYPAKRLFSLNRSGFAGTQRYSIFPWSGDVNRSWEGYRAQLPVMLGMSICGVPYMHSDAGGFASGNGDQELYVRWLQFAVYTPVFRPHGQALYDLDPNTFSFPSEPALMDEPYRSMAKQCVLQRYKMLPYNYTLAYRHTVHAEPLARPLHYAFPDDQEAIGIEDQYMWGPSLMVAPILYPGAEKRDVYLPSGKWYAEGSNVIMEGRQHAEVETPLGTMPVFVQAGSILPYAERRSVRTTNDSANDDITWHYYPGERASSFDLYDDDGRTKEALKQKAFDIIHISIEPKDGQYLVKVVGKDQKYKGRPPVRKMQLLIYDKAFYKGRIAISNTPVRKTIHKKGKIPVAAFQFLYTGKPINFVIRP